MYRFHACGINAVRLARELARVARINRIIRWVEGGRRHDGGRECVSASDESPEFQY